MEAANDSARTRRVKGAAHTHIAAAPRGPIRAWCRFHARHRRAVFTRAGHAVSRSSAPTTRIDSRLRSSSSPYWSIRFAANSKAEVEELLAAGKKPRAATTRAKPTKNDPARPWDVFLRPLRSVTVLDPAAGPETSPTSA
jgi:hypothetical protein